MISVRVPATSANLGPGYDAVGLALSLSMRIGLDRSPHPEIDIRGTGAGLIPRGPEHPAYRAARFVAELVGESDAQFRLVQENSIPPARGLGGSAAALVGGAVAANDLLGRSLAAPDLLNLVCELDGHPDNAAPALLGGLVIGTLTPVGVSAVRLEPKGLKVVVAVPDFAVSTTAARRVLPERVSHRDAAFNVGRSGLEDVIEAALANGAYGACLSGSGPTVLAFAPEMRAPRIAPAMQTAFEAKEITAQSWTLDIDLVGARVEPPGEVPAPSLEPAL